MTTSQHTAALDIAPVRGEGRASDSRARSGATNLRIGSLNLHAYPNPRRGQIEALAEIIARQECDVVLLQECLRSWLDVICDATGMTGVHSHELPPTTPAASFSPDGCAIAVCAEVSVRRSWRIPPDRFLPATVQRTIFEPPPVGFSEMPERLAYRSSGRSILAELALGEATLVVGSFHATPGSGRVGGIEVGEWKPFFHGAVAIELARLDKPYVFGIDANEPLAETADSVSFHWERGRSGARKIEALLGLDPIHSARDLFRDWHATAGVAPFSPEVLFPTYAPSAKFRRRFDSIWATPEFRLVDFATEFEAVIAAGGDHAMLVAEVRIPSADTLDGRDGS